VQPVPRIIDIATQSLTILTQQMNVARRRKTSLCSEDAQAKEQVTKEHNIEAQLGKRLQYVDILGEKDCISV
jgi:hypothetical protein